MEVLKGMGKIVCSRERKLALECWNLLYNDKLTDLAERNFDQDTADVYFNTSSGNVFLSDEDLNTVMEYGGELDLFINTPDEGHEGFFDELMNDWDTHNDEDKKYLFDLATEDLKDKYKKQFDEINEN